MILTLYILRRMAGPFCFGIGLFTLLFLSLDAVSGVGHVLSERHAAASLLPLYMANRLPWVLMMTIPMASLLACMTAFGRLSQDGELVALQAIGTTLLQVAAPGLLFCLFVGAVAFGLGDALAPDGMRQADALLTDLQRTGAALSLAAPPRLISNGLVVTMSACTVDADDLHMHGLSVVFFRDARRAREIYADDAEWTGQLWLLKHMHDTTYGDDGRLLHDDFTERAWLPLPLDDPALTPTHLSHPALRPDAMNSHELAQQIQTIRVLSQADPSITPRLRRLLIAWHQRFSFPATAVVFGLIAIPMGIQPRRTLSAAPALALCLLSVLVYYMLATACTLIGSAGMLSPILAAWLPNLVVGGVGLYLMRNLSSQGGAR